MTINFRENFSDCIYKRQLRQFINTIEVDEVAAAASATCSQCPLTYYKSIEWHNILMENNKYQCIVTPSMFHLKHGADDDENSECVRCGWYRSP